MEKEKASTSAQPVTINLLEPIKFGEETIAQIVLQPIRGKHLKKMPAKPEMDDLMNLASKLSGVPLPVFDEMIGKDIVRIGEAVGEML